MIVFISIERAVCAVERVVGGYDRDGLGGRAEELA